MKPDPYDATRHWPRPEEPAPVNWQLPVDAERRHHSVPVTSAWWETAAQRLAKLQYPTRVVRYIGSLINW